MSVNLLTDTSYVKGGPTGNQINARVYNLYIDGTIIGPTGATGPINYSDVDPINGKLNINGLLKNTGNDQTLLAIDLTNAGFSGTNSSHLYYQDAANNEILLSNGTGGHNYFITSGPLDIITNNNFGVSGSSIELHNLPSNTNKLNLYIDPTTDIISKNTPAYYTINRDFTTVSVVGTTGNLQLLAINANTFSKVGQSVTFKTWGTSSSNNTASVVFSFELAGILYSIDAISVGNTNGSWSLDSIVMLTALSGNTGSFQYSNVFNYYEAGLTNPYISVPFNTGASLVTFDITTQVGIGSYVAITGTSTWNNYGSKLWFSHDLL